MPARNDGPITVSIDGFAQVTQAWMRGYKDATDEQVRKSTDLTAMEVRKRTAAASPKKTGKYKGGWRTKVTANARMRYQRTVYNAPRYYLTHLLENGHGVQKGSNTAGYARARHHIVGDAETEIIFRDKLRQQMEGGG